MNTIKIKVWLTNIVLAALYFYYAYNNVNSLIAGFKLSVFLLLLFNTSVIILALIRRSPVDVTKSSFDYIIAFCGTLSPLLFLGMPSANDHIAFLTLQIVGILFSFGGLMSLNRSFGLVPANRGIVTAGLYKYVRHPLYSGYVLLCSGFLFQNFSTRNLIAFIVFIIFESLRILIEEQFLSKDSSYKEYMKTVRWRVIPYVW